MKTLVHEFHISHSHTQWYFVIKKMLGYNLLLLLLFIIINSIYK